ETNVPAQLVDDLVDLSLGQLVLLGVGRPRVADDVRCAAASSDHSAVALVPGRSAGRVALDGDQGAAFDDFDEADVVDRVRVAGELEEDEVTGLRITCVPLAALAVPVAH